MKERMIPILKALILITLNVTIIALALYIHSTPKVAVPPAENVLSKLGSRGTEVQQIQQKLQSLGIYSGSVDGIYGTQTMNAVKNFQSRKGLTVDGIAGPATLKALGLSTAGSSSVLQMGSRGNEVRQVQQKLKNLGLLSGSVDGIFGEQTLNAVRAFQKQKGLTVDGRVGPATKKALGLTNSTAPSGGSQNNYELLARIISAESRGESYTGQVAVGAVVLNRVEHPSFPDTVSGVIYQSGAFSSVKNGQFNQPVAESCYRAARDALNGWDPSGGAIYFYNPQKTSDSWIRSRPVITQIGSHVFAR